VQALDATYRETALHVERLSAMTEPEDDAPPPPPKAPTNPPRGPAGSRKVGYV
jgi:hypothetical protein